jgi:hypothetical protein
MSSGAAIALITAVVILSIVVWFDRRAPADVASTNDRDLRYFARPLIIVISFPVGRRLYMLVAKGPGRFR